MICWDLPAQDDIPSDLTPVFDPIPEYLKNRGTKRPRSPEVLTPPPQRPNTSMTCNLFPFLDPRVRSLMDTPFIPEPLSFGIDLRHCEDSLQDNDTQEDSDSPQDDDNSSGYSTAAEELTRRLNDPDLLD